MASVSVESVGCKISRRWTLRDVSFEVNAGETLAVFGRAGSGKTILAKVVGGLIDPSCGRVVVSEGAGHAPPAGAAAAVSLALQEPAYAPELSVYDNLGFWAALWGIPRRLRARRVTSLLELLGLSEVRSRPAGLTSSGQKRRLEIARMLLGDSPAMVIDGILDSLEPALLEKLWDHLLTALRETGRCAVVCSSAGKVASMCGKLVVLDGGRVVYTGVPEDFRKRAGEDMVVVGDIRSPHVKDKIRQQFAVTVSEEDGFLSFKVGNSDRMVADLLTEFGAELGCVYLKRPTLEDALDVSGLQPEPAEDGAQV